MRAAQRTLTGRVPGGYGGYTSLIKATGAQRSLPVGSEGVLLRLYGIGVLRVSCSRRPHSSFALTPFATGEGPPTVLRGTRS